LLIIKSRFVQLPLNPLFPPLSERKIQENFLLGVIFGKKVAVFLAADTLVAVVAILTSVIPF
jgi:hypothetical protein